MQADSGSGVAGGGLVLRQVGDSGTGAQTQTIQVDADGQIIGKDTVKDRFNHLMMESKLCSAFRLCQSVLPMPTHSTCVA